MTAVRMETRPRRRMFDGIDAGFRVFSALFNVGIWVFVLAIMATSDIRGSGWVWAAAALGLPLIGKLFFAGWAVRAWLVERRWLAAEHAARTSPGLAPPRLPLRERLADQFREQRALRDDELRRGR